MQDHKVVIWSGIVAFFSNLILITIFNLYHTDERIEYVGALITGLLTAGSVYAQQKLTKAKEIEDKKDVV